MENKNYSNLSTFEEKILELVKIYEEKFINEDLKSDVDLNFSKFLIEKHYKDFKLSDHIIRIKYDRNFPCNFDRIFIKAELDNFLNQLKGNNEEVLLKFMALIARPLIEGHFPGYILINDNIANNGTNVQKFEELIKILYPDKNEQKEIYKLIYNYINESSIKKLTDSLCKDYFPYETTYTKNSQYTTAEMIAILLSQIKKHIKKQKINN